VLDDLGWMVYGDSLYGFYFLKSFLRLLIW
jgi:hypothetical protein